MIKGPADIIIRSCKRFSPNNKRGMSLESKWRAYLSKFGGSNKFSSVSHLFDEIFDQDFELIEQDGQVYSREMLRQCHAYFFETGSEAFFHEFKYLDHNHAEVRFVVVNDETEIIVHSFVTVDDNKFINQRPFERSLQHHQNGAYLRELRRG
jgi:hypothetical protein